MAFAPGQLSQSWCSVLAPAAGGGKPSSTEAWMRRLGWLTAVVAGIAAAIAGPAARAASPGLEGVPRFAHIVVIFEENKDYAQIVGGVFSPNLTRLAKTYGD